MALRDVLHALNETELVAAPTEARLGGEGQVSPARVAEQASEDAFDAPMMVLSQINEA
ncbi:hypothetical protein [Micromonospora sp. DT62]|uniref:hypothetical protein n=1 Tax=Micromonospora sp. DT62 TaxID=3416521 RepID=UPI003CF0A7D7